MKDKIAKKQKAQWEAKKERLSERQRLLREWESDQRGRYERTLGLGLHFFSFSRVLARILIQYKV